MRRFRNIVEQQIANAQASGGFTNLEGEGKPLPERPVETSEQAATSTAMRMMAGAGALPEEFELAKQLSDARAAYVLADTDLKRMSAMRKISGLELRHNIAQEARKKFLS